MSKYSLRLAQLVNAFTRFEEVLAQPKNSFMRDSAIQRFEFTADLAWKVLQCVLEEQFGIRANAPKTAMRLAHENGLIADLPSWLAMTDDRNLSSHSYDEEVAEMIYTKLPQYAILTKTLVETLQHVAHHDEI